MSACFKSETEMGKLLIPWLEDQGWEVFPEVQPFTYGPIADIIAVRERIVWVIELKKSMTLTLLAQAHWWFRYAHYVSVAVPRVKRNQSTKAQDFGDRIATSEGMGVLILDERYGGSVREKLPPRLRRKACVGKLLDLLNDGHKEMGRAGSNKSEYWTPFKETVQNLKNYLRQNPGATFQEVMDNTKHHYQTSATARSCIVKYIKKGIIKGIRIDTSERKHRLFLE